MLFVRLRAGNMIYTKVTKSEDFDAYPGETILDRVKAFAEEFKLETTGIQQVTVHPIVYTMLIAAGADLSNVVVDSYMESF